MKNFLSFFIACLLAAPVFSLTLADCNGQYDQCITSCCSQCGSTLATDAAGDLVCNVGTQSNPNQACINACNPCSTAYQACAASASSGPDLTTTRTGCCAAILLACLTGLFVFTENK